MKPAEIKKRARRLAQEGKLVDAIRALEGLTTGDIVDPYDLVTLGDLCTRSARAEDAKSYYERAVEAYRDASLHRNGIALCRKVLRSHPHDPRFVFLLAELCDREGLVLDAVDGYLAYADRLDGDTEGAKALVEPLSRLMPRSMRALRRQAEFLVRHEKGQEAITLLNRAEGILDDPAEMTALSELRSRLVDLGGEALDIEIPAEEESPTTQDAPTETTGTETAAALRDLTIDMSVPADSPAGAAPPTEAAPPAPQTAEQPATDETPSWVTESVAVELTSLLGEPKPEEPASRASIDPSLADSPQAPPEGASGPVESRLAEGVEDFWVKGQESPPPREPRTGARAASVELEAERKRLEASLLKNPFDANALGKLLEIYEHQGDSLTVLDLRERLAQALLQEGRATAALEQYGKILEVDPNRAAIRECYERLAAEIRRATETAPEAKPAAAGSARPSRGMRGLSKLEVADETRAPSEDDLVDLGALLDEFREGLSSTMDGAPAQAHYDIGLSHLEMGLVAEAAEAFERASAEPSIEAEARELWGRCLVLLERWEDACRVLRAALALRPESLGIRYQLGRALESGGERSEALRFYQSIQREDPDFEDVPLRVRALGGPDCSSPPSN